MSLQQLNSGLLLQQAVLPYTFTTGELDSLKAKLQAAESQLVQQPTKNASMLPMTQSEIRTLLRMIDMTYLQGLSGTGHYVQDAGMAGMASTAGMAPMLHSSQFASALGGNPMNAMQQSAAFGQFGQFSAANGSLQQQLSSAGFGGGGGAFSAMNGLSHHQQPGAVKNPPPANYVCHKCNVGGHWIQECPLNVQQQPDYNKPPPTNYLCHRCGIPGHWIKNCPTNGNPTFDNKPHLKNGHPDDGSVSNPNAVVAAPPLDTNTINSNDMSAGAAGQLANTTAAQPPSKKRRLNQM